MARAWAPLFPAPLKRMNKAEFSLIPNLRHKELRIPIFKNSWKFERLKISRHVPWDFTSVLKEDHLRSVFIVVCATVLVLSPNDHDPWISFRQKLLSFLTGMVLIFI